MKALKPLGYEVIRADKISFVLLEGSKWHVRQNGTDTFHVSDVP